MLLYAAGAADERERADAEARLASGDPASQASYAEAIACVSAMPLALPRVEPPTRVRDRVLLNILASTQQSSPAPRTTWSARPWALYGATAVAAALAVALTLSLARSTRMSEELAQQRAHADETRNVFASPYVRLAKFGDETASPSPRPSARLAYCPVSNQYQLMVFHLAPPSEGKVYELWLVTPDEQTKVPAGTFTVDAEGSATHYVKIPRDMDFALAQITDEPVGGSKAPTGKVHLSGRLRTP